MRTIRTSLVNPGITQKSRAERIAIRTARLAPMVYVPRIKLTGRAQLNILLSGREADGIGSVGVNFFRYMRSKEYTRLNLYHHHYSNPGFRKGLDANDLVEYSRSVWDPADISILLAPPAFAGEERDAIWNFLGYKIGVFFWEASELPREWLSDFRSLDKIIVTSEYNRKIFENAGLKTQIIPIGIDSIPREFREDKIFTVGNVSTLSDRKNIIGLVRAFKLAFPNKNDVRLKITCRFTEPGYKNRVITEIDKDVRIHLNTTSLNKEEYLKWWDDLDCYLSMSRAEGFGKPAREALNKGIPVIVPMGQAEQDLADAGVAEGIPIDKMIPGRYDFLRRDFGLMPDPSVNMAAELLRKIYSNPDSEKIKRGQEWVKQFTWDNFGKRIEEILISNGLKK